MAKAADYGLGPNTFPRGWFVVAESRELDKGPIGVTFFGRDFALYRGESGKPVMLDAYCSHMGTHLAKNTSAMIVIADVPITDGDTTPKVMLMTSLTTMAPALNPPRFAPIPLSITWDAS